jgi:predicted nucleic acid-binding protein
MTKSLVVDASFAFKLILPGARQASSQGLVTEWKRAGYRLCAPTLWIYEITSALCKAVHFAALTPDQGQRALMLALKLDVQPVPPDDVQARLAFDWTVCLKRAVAYDSFYLALAETMECELWTADKRLCNAVDQPWVRWAGES